MHPVCFFYRQNVEQDIGYLLMMERIVASWAYAEAKGIYWPALP
jgi:hypothetical protein